MLGMSYKPSPEAIALARRVKRTLQRMGMLTKNIPAAIRQPDDEKEMSEKYVTDMLDARRPLSLWRFFTIDGFQVEFARVLLEHQDYLVLPCGDIRVIEVERTPVKASLPDVRAKEIA